MEIVEKIALAMGTNNTPRIASLLRRGKIEYATSGSPSCWSDWYTIHGKAEAERIFAEEERRAGFGYTAVDFRVAE